MSGAASRPIFTCAFCGQVVVNDNPGPEGEARAQAELRANFGDFDPSDCAVACDDCYGKIIGGRS